MWSNHQAARLTSAPVPPRNRDEFLLSPAGSARPVEPSRLREVALSTLDSMGIVGTTDDLAVVYAVCLRRLGREPDIDAPVRAMVGAGLGQEISQSTRDWLLGHNTVDSALFERARARRAELGIESDQVSGAKDATGAA